MLGLTPFLALAIGLWYIAYRTGSGGPRTVSGLFLLYIALLLVVRAAVLVFGIDTPYPDAHFAGLDTAALAITALAMVSVWSLLVGLGTYAVPGARAPLTPPRRGERTTVHRLASALTFLAIVGSVPLWIRYGGPTGLTTAIKVERVQVSHVFRAPASLGAYCAMAAALAARPRTRARYYNLALYATCAAIAFSWGARDAAVYPLVLIALVDPVRISDAAHAVRRSVSGRRVAVTALAVLLLAVPLRLARDTAIIGAISPSIDGQSAVRQISVATNLTVLDSLMLLDAAREPIQDNVRFGQFFAPLVSGADTNSISVVTARTYEPQRRAGWPTSPIGEWFATLGAGGVVLGGLASGVFAGAAMIPLRRINRFDSPLAHVVLVVLCTQIAAGGIWSHTLIRSIIWFGVLALVAIPVALTLPRTRGSPMQIARQPLSTPSTGRPP